VSTHPGERTRGRCKNNFILADAMLALSSHHRARSAKSRRARSTESLCAAGGEGNEEMRIRVRSPDEWQGFCSPDLHARPFDGNEWLSRFWTEIRPKWARGFVSPSLCCGLMTSAGCGSGPF
jgi:hypothetical protein